MQELKNRTKAIAISQCPICPPDPQTGTPLFTMRIFSPNRAPPTHGGLDDPQLNTRYVKTPPAENRRGSFYGVG